MPSCLKKITAKKYNEHCYIVENNGPLLHGCAFNFILLFGSDDYDGNLICGMGIGLWKTDERGRRVILKNSKQNLAQNEHV